MDGGKRRQGEGRQRLTSRPWRPAGDENSWNPISVVCVRVWLWVRAEGERSGAHVGQHAALGAARVPISLPPFP